MITFRRADVPRPARSLNLTAKLKDTANISEPQLSFQRKAVQDFHSRQAQPAQVSQPAENNRPSALLTPDAPLHSSPSAGVASTPQNKRNISSITDDDTDAEDDQPEHRTSSNITSRRTNHDSNAVTGKKKCATLGNPVAIDVDGLLEDVDVQSVDDNPSSCDDKRQDCDQFFCPPVIKMVKGKRKGHCECKLCP